MRKSITFGILLFANFLYSQQDLSSQNINNISNTASPNAAGFMRFQESSINHYNGRGNFSIPIYEINVGGIKYPISLNYSQGGIQVNSIASDVGLGWSLTSTLINRTVVGDADLETIKDFKQYQQKQKYGYFDYVRIYQNDGNAPGNGYPSGIVDFFPDIFKFVSPTNSSRFYFKNRNQVVELDQKESQIGWLISPISSSYLLDYNENWVNSETYLEDYLVFNVITKDGIQYNFQDKDITHSFTDGGDMFSFGGITGTYPRVSSWNVSSIKNLNNNEEINFTYEMYSSENTNSMMDIMANHPYIRYESVCPSATVMPYQNNLHYGQGGCDNGHMGWYYNRMLEIQRLKRIDFRGGYVEFNYGQNREDLKNGQALTGIFVKDTNGKVIKEYLLEYDYFVSNPAITVDPNGINKRLKLLSVKEQGQNKYQFEYYEDQRLPAIGSALQDIFGYNNSTNNTDEPNSNQTPRYYYYPNKSEYSILPYDIQSDTYHFAIADYWSYMNGLIDKEPNDLSKTWSLKKVKFPTGGSSEYVLESNTFNLWGNNLKGGGTRLQQQIIKEKDGGQQRIIEYNYNNDTSTTSGYLFNMPQVGYPASILTSSELGYNWFKNYFVLFSTAKINYDLVNNFFIGYSKVEENEDGVRTVYEFANNEFPNIQTRTNTQSVMGQFLISNSNYGNDFYIDNSYKRGKLKNIKYYEKYNIAPIKMKEFIYKGYEGVETENFPDRHYVMAPSLGYQGEELLWIQKSYNTIYNNLTYTKTTSYFPSGNIDDEGYNYYNLQNQNLTATAHKLGSGVTYPKLDLKKFYYPIDIRNNAALFTPDLSEAGNLMDVYKDNVPVLTQSYSGEIDPSNISYIAPSKMTSQVKAVFSKDSNTSGMILPTQALTAIGQNAFYEVAKLGRYDSRGNLLQSTKDGLSTTYLYGYNQLYPIAKIEGATYDQVMTALGVPNPTSNSSYLSLDIVTKSNADNDEASENDLINFLDAFRKHANLTNYRVTTYTYNPLVGVTSVTPPSGMREVYIYEAVTNKLKEVKRMEKDAGGTYVYRTLKEYEYHYKP